MAIVRFFAAARAAAGVDEQLVQAHTLAEALAAVRRAHDQRLTTVLAVCSFLVDGAPVGTRDPASIALTPTAVVDCLPPFAGG